MAMVKKKARRRTRRRWIISRDVEIQGVDICIYIEAEGTDLARLRRSMQHLEARGVLTEPLGERWLGKTEHGDEWVGRSPGR